MSETLFAAVECPPVTRKFLWWTWQAPTHSFIEVDRWKLPLHYGTAFYKKLFCLKCWTTETDCNEQYGP